MALLKGALVVAELNFGRRGRRKIPRSDLLDDALLQQFGAGMIEDALENFPDQVMIAVHKRGAKLRVQAFTR